MEIKTPHARPIALSVILRTIGRVSLIVHSGMVLAY